MSDITPKHVYLIDGSGYIFRAFFGLPPMTRPDGTPTNAVYGFCNMVFKLVEETDADYIGVVFDKGRLSFRNDFYEDYKGHRPEAPEDLRPQFPLIRDATAAFNLPVLEMEGFEADDLIATYAAQAAALGSEVTIVSSDKDLMQLIQPGVTMWDPMKSKSIGPDEVMEKFGVTPDKVIDVQALAGDSADNVPGVEGIGPKIAAQLINEYGDLESLLSRANEIKQPKRRERLTEQAELARISKRLVTLDQEVPLDVPLADLKRQDLDHDKILAFLKEQNFRRLISRYEADAAKAAMGGGGADISTSTDQSSGLGQPVIPIAPTETRYSLVQDMESLAGWIQRIEEKGVVAVDTETTALNVTRATLVGISLSVEAGEACYIPLRHQNPEAQTDLLGDAIGDGAEAIQQIPVEEAVSALKPILEDPSILKVGQNLKYDMSVLASEGIRLAPIDDTMLISFALDAGKNHHGMDELSDLHLNIKPIKFEEVAGKGKKQITFDYVPLEKARDYAAEDADLTLRLYQHLKPRLIPEKMTALYEMVERPLVPVLAEMERNGIMVDPVHLKTLSGEFAEKITQLETSIHQLADAEFNVGSPKQLGEILFDKLGLQGGKKTKTGGYSTSSDILEPLAGEHPIIEKILEWRMLSKLKSTYTDALVGAINPKTGRVHTSFNVTGAQTGRLSSTDPNIQNIPIRTEEGRKIREAFVAPEGFKLVSLDYSQIELRLVSEIAGLESMQQAFREGIDIHAMTASHVFGIPLQDMTSDYRRKAKAINFGIIYGISAFGLANQLGVSRGEAKSFIDQYFERFPGIRRFMEATKESCREKGYVETLFGRRIHIGGINEKNPMRRNYAERQAINAPIQGTAADIIKKAMCRIPKAIESAGLKDARMLLQVHDELIFEARKEDCGKLIAVVRDVMENATQPLYDLAVPLIVEGGTGNNWREAH